MAHLILAAGIDGGIVVGLQTAHELTAIADERGVAVQPYRAALHGTIKHKRTVPDIGMARMLFHHIGQYKRSLALLDQTGSATEGTTSKGSGITLNGLRGNLGCRGDSLLLT